MLLFKISLYYYSKCQKQKNALEIPGRFYGNYPLENGLYRCTKSELALKFQLSECPLDAYIILLDFFQGHLSRTGYTHLSHTRLSQTI